MNKDAIIATFIGILVGVGIAAIVLLGPKIGVMLHAIPKPSFSLSLPSFSIWTQKNTENASDVKEQSAVSDITVDSPLPEAIISDSSVMVSGKTIPKSSVVISSLNGDWATTADEAGFYAITVTLIEGINTMNVVSWDNTGEWSKQITVYQTNAKIE